MSLIKAYMSIETDSENVEELRRVLDHHIDYLIDMDNNPDIESIADVISYDSDSKYDRGKLQMLSAIVEDILDSNPSASDYDDEDEASELYHTIHKLASALDAMGY